jgi:hypothetical protein
MAAQWESTKKPSLSTGDDMLARRRSEIPGRWREFLFDSVAAMIAV